MGNLGPEIMKRLIVTADDFGLAIPVNQAVELAHRHGILTAASLMVGAAAAADAVERARCLPSLAVGLHLTVVEGRPVLPPERIPALVGQDGQFLTDLVVAGVRFFFQPGARRQLEAEIRAQFEAFRATGLPLDHVNAHNHIHLHPTVLGLMIKVGRDYGNPPLRLPQPPSRGPERNAARGLGLWLGLMRVRLRRAGVGCNDFMLGLGASGAMTEAKVLELLADLPEGVTEIYFHPATDRCPELDQTMAGYRHQDELAALLSPAVRAALIRQGVVLTTFTFGA
ncbi:chitin disaccharide deacetylase [uncultured Gammaproteobacteria bacterium]